MTPVKREPPEISAIMRRVRSRDTTPELLLRKALWAAGLRFRTCSENLPGKPDIVVHSKRLAIFIDGDFWQTENSYTVLVYYKALSGRHDELVGALTINSRTNKVGY